MSYEVVFRAHELPDAPTLTISSDTVTGLRNELEAVTANSIFALLAECDEMHKASFQLGKHLDAKPANGPVPAVEEAVQSVVNTIEEAKPAVNTWGGGGSSAPWPTAEPEAPAAEAKPAAAGGWPPAPAWAK